MNIDLQADKRAASKKGPAKCGSRRLKAELWRGRAGRGTTVGAAIETAKYAKYAEEQDPGNQ